MVSQRAPSVEKVASGLLELMVRFTSPVEVFASPVEVRKLTLRRSEVWAVPPVREPVA